LTQYFLGNKPGIPEKAKDVLQEKHPGLKVVGTHHGYFKKEGPENEAVIKEINSKKPDILIVGFGMPLQVKMDIR
jgi:N-acetylglucosaminyldiphosphoundecaprenol N-acetyl-beta-D-mannosaminyltransferase